MLKRIVHIILFFLPLIAVGQNDSAQVLAQVDSFEQIENIDSMMQVDTISTRDTTKPIAEIKRLCKKLGLTYNSEANVDLLDYILAWRGTPYCYGGSTKRCTDCSGYTGNIYTNVYQKVTPRISRDIYAKCMPIKKNALYQGDFVFFATAGGDRITHVGIYLWDGYFTHASSSRGVMVSNLNEGYYKRTFVGAGAWLE